MKETPELKDLHWNVNRTEAGSMLSSLGTEIEPLREIPAREGGRRGFRLEWTHVSMANSY